VAAPRNTIVLRGLALFIASLCLYNAIRGIKTGDVASGHSSSVRRSEDPVLFWFAVVTSGLAAIFLLVGVITGHLD
jgi:hypothetical protein